MQKPNNYEATQASGDFTPVELGGHKLIVKQVTEKKSSTGKEMIVVLFDFAPSDKQPGYFMDQFKNDIRPEKKWPHQATKYILTQDDKGDCSRNLKTFTTCIEKSNSGFSVQWGDRFCECLKNKYIGGVFGIVEDEYNGEIKRKRELRWFCSMDKVDEAAIPDDKLIAPKTYSGNATPGPDGFMNIENTDLDELPFV